MENNSLYGYAKRNFKEGNNTNIYYLGNTINAKSVLSNIDKLAFFLYKNIKNANEIVTISLPNMPEAIYALYGANKIGLKVALLNPLLKENSFLSKLKEFKSKTVFLLDTQYAEVKNRLKEMNIRAIVASPSDSAKGIYKWVLKLKKPKITLNDGDLFFNDINQIGEVDEKNNGGDIAVLIHSSGTTGIPKASLLTNYAINKVATQLVEEGIKGDYTSDETLLAVLPIFHAFGLTVCFQTAMFRGNIILFPRFEKELIVKFMRKYRVNFIPAVPTMLKRLMSVKKFDGRYLKDLRFVFCGGDRISEQVKNQFNDILIKNRSSARIQEGYGLTEISGVFSLNPLDKIKEGSVGKTFKDNSIMVVTKDGTQALAGVYGEIFLNTTAFIDGYYEDTVSTKEIFVEIDGKKWLRTGDVGYVDDEGYLYFVDRIKRSIKIGATNVFPAEVEQCVGKLDFVEHCCVIRKKDDNGSYTKLLVEVRGESHLTIEMKKEIEKIVLNNLNKYSVPKQIEQVGTLRMTPMGKIDYGFYENENNN